MPWPGVPDFNDGEVLGAAKLNQISDAIEFLHGIITGVNMPFKTVGGGSNFNQTYRIRHLGQYLHYQIAMSSGQSDQVRIYYNSVLVFDDDTDRDAPYLWEGYVDLHDTMVIDPIPTLREFYTLEVDFDYNTPGDAQVHYILESNATSL